MGFKKKKKVSKAKPKVMKRVHKKRKVRSKPSIVVGGRSFSDPKEIAAFYRAEAARMKEAMKQFKIDQAEGNLSIAKNDFMKIRSQKKKLELIEKDLEAHKDILNKKIKSFSFQKDEQANHEKAVKEFTRKMKALENEAKKLQDTRDQLMMEEGKLISRMKDLVKSCRGELDLTDLKSVSKLNAFERSKEAELIKARHLLSDEMASLFSDSSVLNNLDDKAHKKLVKLNTKLAKVQGDRQDALKRRHLLEISEEDVSKKLDAAADKVKKLERKYQELLKS